jgi:hypothetical protein
MNYLLDRINRIDLIYFLSQFPPAVVTLKAGLWRGKHETEKYQSRLKRED